MLRLILVLLFTLSFAGCMDLNGNSSSHDESDVENPSGIWIGSQTIVGTGVFDMKTIIYVILQFN
jgi:glycine/serine hydroxymethyltransferase